MKINEYNILGSLLLRKLFSGNGFPGGRLPDLSNGPLLVKRLEGGGEGGCQPSKRETPPFPLPHRRKEDSEKVGGIASVEGRCLTTQVRIPSIFPAPTRKF
jgi:hypothetical protein